MRAVQPSPQAGCGTRSAGVVDRDKALVRRWFDEGFEGIPATNRRVKWTGALDAVGFWRCQEIDL
jgi:hypothetical protein